MKIELNVVPGSNLIFVYIQGSKEKVQDKLAKSYPYVYAWGKD